MIIVGSDEVWNFHDMAYSPIKFGDGLTSVHVTYSASAGGSSAKEEHIPDEVKRGIGGFRRISVRDAKTEELVRTVCDCQVIRTLDPVFLFDYRLKVRETIRKIAMEKPYLLIYDCKLNSKQIEELTDYAKANDCRILGAGEYRNWYATTSTTNITPDEWAFLFKNATAIVTGTFHGASFAIKYNSPFVSYLTEQNRINKVESLLSDLGLAERIVDSRGNVGQVLAKPIDYRAVNETLQQRKETSIAYIRECIDEVRKER